MFLLKIPKYPVLRIIMVGRELQDHIIQPSTQNYQNHPKTPSQNDTSRCLLNTFTSRDVDSTTSGSSLFQWLSTLGVKKNSNILPEPPLVQLEALPSCSFS